MRVIALIDGEHHPPVVRDALDRLAAEHEIVSVLFVGGGEKVSAAVLADPRAHYGRDVVVGSELPSVDADGVFDLSGEPVLTLDRRLALAAVTLDRGLEYHAPGLRLTPPPRERIASAVPIVAVIGTGKRTGKTAVAGAVARLAASMDLAPIVVAMGRGGPPEPEVAEAGSVDLARLLELVREGRHAASDYLEDALTTGVTTVGARRAGGGLAGGPWASNVREAAELAAARDPGLVILEGSGAAVPPVPWDAGVLVVPASAPPEYLGGYLGPFRLLLSDLVVFTMAADPDQGSENLSALRSHLQRFHGDARHVVTDLSPVPLADVQGRRAFFATTAPMAVAERQVRHLEAVSGCTVVGWSARLADRAGLMHDLDEADDYDVLLTELKAAAVDFACERAIGRGAEVVFVDNRVVAIEGEINLDVALREVVEVARQRGGDRH